MRDDLKRSAVACMRQFRLPVTAHAPVGQVNWFLSNE